MIVCGCAQLDQKPPMFDPSSARDTLPLMPGEQIDVSFGHRDMPDDCYLHTIDADGNIILVLIGAIHVAGLSPEAAGERIQSEYVPHYYLRLNIRVSRLTPEAKDSGSLGRREH